ncbi:MAG: hypothetical protein PHC62_00150 [Candidatus Izemoplasmatales bacterium]|nr:hypothetical protein [Candidatus Izemoplasmatales bacterium]
MNENNNDKDKMGTRGIIEIVLLTIVALIALSAFIIGYTETGSVKGAIKYLGIGNEKERRYVDDSTNNYNSAYNTPYGSESSVNNEYYLISDEEVAEMLVRWYYYKYGANLYDEAISCFGLNLPHYSDIQLAYENVYVDDYVMEYTLANWYYQKFGRNIYEDVETLNQFPF